MQTSGQLLQPTHSLIDKTVYILPKWESAVSAQNQYSIIQYFVGYSRNVGGRGRREAKDLWSPPLKVNMGLKLHLRCCEDLRLISFRCWLAGVWLREGTHIFAVSHYRRLGRPCLEEQSRLCAYLPTGSVWPSAAANWQHAACSDTSGKTNI